MLKFRFITCENDPQLLHFYDAYNNAFILSNEKEDITGFRELLALNRGKDYERLSSQFGHYEENILILTNELNEILAGANFTIFTGDNFSTISLSYIFVNANQRRRGLFKLLMNKIGNSSLIFIEINNPLKMSYADYEQDSAHSGIDQIERLKFWEKHGARLIPIEYCQPPLSLLHTTENNLLVAVLNGSSISACQLFIHFRRFFAISVLKGNDLLLLNTNSMLSDLKIACDQNKYIQLTDFGEFYEKRLF
jgi:hypothetical protein